LSNVMDTKDMSDIGLKNRYPEPEDPRTGRRRPHVPSSKPTMSKSHHFAVPRTPKRQNQADNHPPRFLLPGDWVSVYVGDRSFQPFEAAFPSGEAAYMEGVPTRQRLFSKKLQCRGFLRFSGGLRCDLRAWPGRIAPTRPSLAPGLHACG